MSSSIESNLPSKSSYISSNESLSFFRREQWKKCHLPLRAICRPSLRTSRQMSRCRFSVANNGKMSSSIESNLPSKSSYIASNESLSFFRREQWKKCHLPLRAICRPRLRTSRQMSRCRFSVANNGKNVIFH